LRTAHRGQYRVYRTAFFNFDNVCLKYEPQRLESGSDPKFTKPPELFQSNYVPAMDMARIDWRAGADTLSCSLSNLAPGQSTCCQPLAAEHAERHRMSQGPKIAPSAMHAHKKYKQMIS